MVVVVVVEVVAFVDAAAVVVVVAVVVAVVVVVEAVVVVVVVVVEVAAAVVVLVVVCSRGTQFAVIGLNGNAKRSQHCFLTDHTDPNAQPMAVVGSQKGPLLERKDPRIHS